MSVLYERFFPCMFYAAITNRSLGLNDLRMILHCGCKLVEFKLRCNFDNGYICKTHINST